MIPWLVLLSFTSLSIINAAESTKILGVPPDLASKYVPSKSGTWKCLDGSKEIPWSFVNDDSCDCSDGSDEPGTGACPNTQFYCENAGHIGAFIPSSRVRDGLCEAACCDGSDERPGMCPNSCKEIGQEYQKQRDAEIKVQRAGAKVRSTYIAFAHQEKKRLQTEVERLEQEIEAKEKEVDRLHDIAERAESLSQVALEHKKKSPLFQSLVTHQTAIKSLKAAYEKHLEREKALGEILDTLRTGYNPNYQDMAVLEAVRGWEQIAKLPHINDVGKGEGEASGDVSNEESLEEDVLEDGLWTEEELSWRVDPVINSDHVQLILEHEEHIEAPQEGSLLFDIAAYLPDSVVPAYEDFKDAILSLLTKLGIAKGHEAADSSRARQAYQDAESVLETMKREKDEKENEIKEIFNVHGFGAKGEWKKLDGACLEKDTGDYTYEVCLFKEIKQKPNNGGQTFNLGKFESWNPSTDVKPGEPAYYETQVYKHGTRCWNGPERNTKLVLTCGEENVLHTIQELEKCEYQITGTTPALCSPIEGDKKNVIGSKREEL